MISLCVLLVAALVASSAARRSSSSSSESSTDNNEDRKAFVADNVANFEARLNTAVSKALLNKNLIKEFNGQATQTLDQFVRPFLKTYGVKSERDFEKTFELVNALNKRKRNAFILADAGDSDSSSSSSSSSDSSDDSNRAQDAVDQFLASFDDQDNKDAFRLAVLKEALVQHLRHGR
jgi:hypothetical protein